MANRLERLAKAAERIKRLSVTDQFQTLGAMGLRLDDINWKNRVSDPTLQVSRIPMRGEGTTQAQKTVR